MEESVTVIIGTFGNRKDWNSLSQRALASVASQERPPDEVIRYHGETLHDARNRPASIATSKWLLFLDADDELEPGYIRAMMAASGDLRYPRVRYVPANENGQPRDAAIQAGRGDPLRHIREGTVLRNRMAHPQITTHQQKPLLTGNYMVIGTMVERERFLGVGGFRDLAAWEDWDLWIRCCIHGALPSFVPDAIYRAYKRPGSRNVVKEWKQLWEDIITYSNHLIDLKEAEGNGPGSNSHITTLLRGEAQKPGGDDIQAALRRRQARVGRALEQQS